MRIGRFEVKIRLAFLWYAIRTVSDSVWHMFWGAGTHYKSGKEGSVPVGAVLIGPLYITWDKDRNGNVG